MKKLIFSSITWILPFAVLEAQQMNRITQYRASVQREDSRLVVFDFELKDSAGVWKGWIRNAGEKIQIDNIKILGDSMWMEMPLFESQFKARFMPNGEIRGIWIKGTALAAGFQVYPFLAQPGKDRFDAGQQPPKANLSGRWAVTLVRTDGSTRPAVAEFRQEGAHLIGTMLTPGSDYRYLEGVVRGDSLFLSTFDGSHSFLFNAKIENDSVLSSGHFYAGFRGNEPFTARKNEHAEIPADLNAVYVKKGEDRLNFDFPDLEGKKMSINDPRFRNKVVVVQLMGSWCPNCMDETAFLSPYYMANKSRGLEMVALAYENSTDFLRSQKSLRKFQQRFQIEYPMLITGVSVNDSLRTEKTLPQITPIKGFPTSIFLDKKGRIRHISTGFFGPGTGEHYTEYIREFEMRVDALLRE